MPNQIYALIMAGGTGSRLWPRSRTHHPKQFLDLMGDLTMLQQAQTRLLPLITPENTFVATAEQYIETVARQLPEMPSKNIIGEPVGRGTAAAIGLAALHIQRQDPDAIMVVLTADHLIKKVDVFRRALESASYVAGEGWLVTLGITPDYPETGYGYIERGELLGTVGDFEGFEVLRFVEKPNLEKARKYIENGGYDWNSGMFIWQVSRILHEMSIHLPELYAGLSAIGEKMGTADYPQTLERVFPSLPNVTIDYGIMEKAQKVAVLPIEIGWNDIGSWSAVYDVLPKDPLNNAVIGNHISPDTSNSLIVSPGRLIATIGLDDVVIIDTEDVTLVCRRDRTQDVKQIVDILKQNGSANYLDGTAAAKPLSHEEVDRLFEEAALIEQVLLSLLLHAGMWPSFVVSLKSDDIDFIQGWVNTPEGKRPLPKITRQILFEWMQTKDSMHFTMSEYWQDSEYIKKAIKMLGERAGFNLTVDRLYETLARSLFETSDEGQAVRNILGEETDLVRVPLHALFPFSQKDFFDNRTTDAVRNRAHRVLNSATQILGGFKS